MPRAGLERSRARKVEERGLVMGPSYKKKGRALRHPKRGKMFGGGGGGHSVHNRN
jgi:hypothetical protein